MASNVRPMTTPPDRLVSSFTFRSSETISATLQGIGDPASRPLRQTVLSDCKSFVEPLQLPSLEIREWEGRVVFADSVPSSSTRHSHDSLASYSPPRISPNQGSERSPISVSSDSSPEKLSRPRGKPIYTTRLSSTAYTPPRPILPSIEPDWKQNGSGSGSRSSPSKPVHPFFSRDFVRSKSAPPPPPPASRPRLVAHYSSTSASGSSQSQSQTRTESQGSTWSINRKTEIELVEQKIQPYRATSPSEYSDSDGERYAKGAKGVQSREDEMDLMMRDLGALSIGRRASRDTTQPVSKLSARRALGTPTQLPINSSGSKLAKKLSTSKNTNKPIASSSTDIRTSTTQAAKKPLPPPISYMSSLELESSAAKPPTNWITSQTVLPQPSSGLPLFTYRTLLPAPRIIYTSDPDEANDLLSCLKGNVLGFDLEWPMNHHKTPEGRPAGSVWDPITNKLKFVQPRVALMQVCDEKMVVLIQIWDMKKIPEKAIELLQDPAKYKLGVQVRGDGQKLLRDHSDQFPKGISSLLELSYLARRAEPILLGPGNSLISLARLVAAFLGINLEKGDARRSNWTRKLDIDQVEYAANDVVCSVELFKELSKRAKKNNITVDLNACCSNLGRAVGSVTSRSTIEGGSASPVTMPIVPGIKPREQRAFDMFKSGSTMVNMAQKLQVQVNTVHAYVCAALLLLPDNALTREDKERFLNEVPKNTWVRKQYNNMFRKLRRAVGEEDVSESEPEA